MTGMEEHYKRRIGYKGKLDDVSSVICKDFSLGNFLSNDLITLGYEDFNFCLQTSNGKYFVKVFSNFRDLNDCKRYVDVMERAKEAGVATPSLLKSKQGHLHTLEVNHTKLRLCVMEFVDGNTFYGRGEYPNRDEIRYIASQASLINSIDIKPKPVYDSWAITNFPAEFQKKSKYLSPEDEKVIRPLLEEFDKLKIHELPHSFVHGDIISTNLMKDENDKLWIIDFAVSNYYPRIQELAVLASDVLFNAESQTESQRNLDVGLEEYQKRIQLTDRELKALPIYIKIAHAMHVLCSSYEKGAQNNTTEENEYWLKRGRQGLEQMLR